MDLPATSSVAWSATTSSCVAAPCAELAEVVRGYHDIGVRHIVALRGEANDTVDVARVAPHIEYVWLGTHDAGGDQDFSWFDDGVAAVTGALADPDARGVVHCHMGVNRAPSMAYAALLRLGHGIEEGLDAGGGGGTTEEDVRSTTIPAWDSAPELRAARGCHCLPARDD